MARKRPGLVAMRRVAAVVAAFVGLFVIFFGLGYGSPAVSLTGVAVILLAVASRLVGMFRGTLRQWVVGVGRVVHVSDPPPSAPYGRCQLELIVDAPGLPQEAVIIREPRVPVAQWPYPGLELSIEVAADDIRNVRILWPDSLPEEEPDPLWDDDQPRPVPAEPPGSHLEQPDDDYYDEGGYRDDAAEQTPQPAAEYERQPEPHRQGPHGKEPDPRGLEPDPHEEVDFDLDGPPHRQVLGPAAPGVASPPDEGRPARHVPLAQEGAARVPSPRPGPRPRPNPHPRPQAAAAAPDPEAINYPSANPAPSGSIHRVGVTLLVADLGRSAAFYRDRLGFHEVDSGPESIVLASGETRLVLRAVHEMDPVHRRVAHLNLEVADIEAVHADLRTAGVKFTYPPRVVDRGTRLELWAAAFKDPDGHGIALTQWRPHGSAQRLSGSAGGAHPRP